MPAPAKLGIIAGGGEAPRRLMAALDRVGRDYVLLCLEGQADPDLPSGKKHVWLPLGSGAKAREFGRSEGVEEVVMIGRVRRPSLSEIRPDWLALQKLTKIGFNLLGDDGLLRAVGKAVEEEGFRLIGVHELFADFLMPEDTLGRVRPDETAWEDIVRGVDVARTLGQLDVGQAVVVQQGIVLGVEASEGTDALIARCKDLKREGPGGVLVKLCKPRQDKRFDLPTIGADTVRRAAEAGLRGIAAEAGNSLIFDRADVVVAADAAGIFVVGMRPDAVKAGRHDG